MPMTAIDKLRIKLNHMIEHDADADEIVEVSIELDKLIEKHMRNQKRMNDCKRYTTLNRDIKHI